MFAMFFVWFAGVVGNLSWAIGLIALLSMAWFIIWNIGVGIHNDSYSTQKPYPLSYRLGKVMVGVSCSMLILWALLPSERTVYMMGGAYMGQSVIESDTAAKVKKILDNKLDQYVQELEGVEKKVADKAAVIVETETGAEK